MFFRAEYQKEPRRLADKVVWSKLVYGPKESPRPGQAPTAPTVVQNKEGSLQTTLHYRGPDVAMMDVQQHCLYLEQWNRLLKRLGTGWALWADEWYEPSTAYPQSTWTNPAAYFVDNVRKTLFDSGQLHETRHYLTLAWQPPSARQSYWFDSIFTRRAAQRLRTEDELHLGQYVRGIEQFADALGTMLPECRWASPQGTLSYLHSCVSWDRHTIAVPTFPEHLDRGLTTARFDHGHTPRLGNRLLRPLGLRYWPDGIGIVLPSLLQHLGFPYRFTVRYVCLDMAKAKRILDGMRRKWEVQVLSLMTHLSDAWNGTKTDWEDPKATVNEEARAYAYALQRALSSLTQGEIAYGYCTPTILVWSDTEAYDDDPASVQQAYAEVDARERAVVKLLQSMEYLVEKETTNATRAWWGSLPGNAFDNVRNPPLSSRATGFQIPHGATWAGPLWDYHFQGPPLFMTSSDGQPFRYVMHQGEVANTMIKGPTRSGKSAWLGLTGMQTLRYPRAHIFAWDRDYSLYCATLMAGGAHYNLCADHSRGFHILGELHAGESEMRWAQAWLQDLLIAQGATVTPEHKAEIWAALLRVQAHPPSERRLSTFVRYLQVLELKNIFTPFLERERYGFFDAAEDSFALGAVWTTFEMGELLDLPEVVPHAMAYIFHRMEKTFDGRPTVIKLDEAWQYFNHPVFRPKIAAWLKAFAKKNVSVEMAVQEVIDSRYSDLWQAIQGSVRTWNFLPNPRALNEDVFPHYLACGLSQVQVEQIAHATEHQDYLYKTDQGCRMYQLRLTAIERCLCAATKPEEIAALQALVARGPEEPLPAAWLRQNNLFEAADLYTEFLSTTQTTPEAPIERALAYTF